MATNRCPTCRLTRRDRQAFEGGINFWRQSARVLDELLSEAENKIEELGGEMSSGWIRARKARTEKMDKNPYAGRARQ
jgi:hypothetical protein